MKQLIGKKFWLLPILGSVLVLAIPLYVDSDFFFPYIFSKALALRVIVLSSVLLWLLGHVIYKKKIVIDISIIVFGAYLLWMYVASFFGVNFYFSFWSSIERSEGLLFWTHLFLWYVLIKNLFDTKELWHWAIDIFLIVAQVVAVIGFLQNLGVPFLNTTSEGSRIASTIGNAAFLGGYLLFAFFFSLYLSIQRKALSAKIYYWVIALFDLYIILKTGTRGAFLGLFGATLIFTIYNALSARSRSIRIASAGVMLVIVILAGSLIALKDEPWMENSYILNRITTISLSDYTAQTRLWTWESAWQGFLERPLLGYGQENFYTVANKYFNPQIFRDSGSQIWFDRAHNVYLDHLLTGGIIGLLLYLAVLIYPLGRFALQHLFPQRGNEVALQNIGHKVRVLSMLGLFIQRIFPKHGAESVWHNIANQLLVLSMFAFFIQGIFVFESLPVYLGFFIVIGFMSFLTQGKSFQLPRVASVALLAVMVVAYVPIMYYTNYREYKANRIVIDGIRLQAASPQQAFSMIRDGIEYNSAGVQEYRLRLAEFVAGLIQNQRIGPSETLAYVTYVDGELLKRIDANPHDAASYLLLARHYNYSYVLDPERLYKVEEVVRKGLELSPTRPQFYSELGYANLYIAKQLRGEGKIEEADAYNEKMIESFDKAIQLNDTVAESYINMIIVLLASDQREKVQEYFDAMDEKGLIYKTESVLQRMANAAVAGNSYDWSVRLYTMLIELQPNNPQYLIGVALSYANLGKNEEAITAALKVKEFGAEYAVQSDEFIEKIRAGEFEPEAE